MRSVLVASLVVGLVLVARSFLLVLGLPLVVGHPIDDLARGRIGDLDALLARLLAVPARQAVAAEAGEIHQIDVLHVRALLQVRDQAAEGGGLEFGLGLVVHGFLLRAKIWAQRNAAATAAPIGAASRRPHFRASPGVPIRSCRTSREQCGNARGLAWAVRVYSYEARAE